MKRGCRETSDAEEAGVHIAEGNHASITEPPPVQCFGGLPEELIGEVLLKADAAALCHLKSVGKVWQLRARRKLVARLCSYDGALTNDPPWNALDVEVLWAAGRPHEAVAAGRHLANLVWLRGYGFKVDVSAVRRAKLKEASLELLWTELVARNCISPSGDKPPRELLLAVVACAGSGSVLGVPVQQLREAVDSSISKLEFIGCDIDSDGAALRALFLPRSKIEHALTHLLHSSQCSLRKPQQLRWWVKFYVCCGEYVLLSVDTL